MSGPRAVIGAPVYNHEGELREAIESILSQTFRDFRLIIVDDCSTDATEFIARQYVELDPRVEYVKNDQRLGMIDNWRRAFEIAVERWPEAEYFAWASDHDVWHPRWLAALVRVLDATPDAVLAYPLHHRMAANSEVTDRRPWAFNTLGVKERLRRFRLALWNMSAGNMIYGLARVRDVKACGVFRHVLVPDRLLIMELSLRGEFYQVPEVLWFRRFYGRMFSLGRQRQSFFPNGRPLYALVPWWISHAAVLGWVYGVQRQQEQVISPRQGVLLSAMYFWLAGLLHFRQQFKAARIAVRQSVRLTGKNLISSRRRQRITVMAVRETRRRARAGVGWTIRTAARGVRAVPGVGPFVLDRLRPEQPQMATEALDLVHIQRTVARLRRTTRTIILGPFLAEPEYELLYWIPFLRWLKREAVIDSDQIIAVSRGGVESWYEGISGRYVEVLNTVRLSEIQTRAQTRWHEEVADRKLAPAALDLNIVGRVTKLFGLKSPRLIHSSEMQRLFRHVWTGAAPPDLIERHIVRQRLVPPVVPAGLKLPNTYVAVRIAFGPTFPDTADNQRASRTIVETLSAGTPVVLLNTGVDLDGLAEFEPGLARQLWRIDSVSTPPTSLAVQSAVIARASQFVGTIGGPACLAAQYGVPSLAVYSDTPGITPVTIETMRRTAAALQTSATAVHVRDIETLARSGTLVSRHEASLHGTN